MCRREVWDTLMLPEKERPKTSSTRTQKLVQTGAHKAKERTESRKGNRCGID